MAEIQMALERCQLEDCVVRVRIKVPARLKGEIQKSEIRNLLSAAYFVAYIEVEAKGEEARTRNPHLTEAQTPAAALVEYIKTREDLLERKDELIEYGQKLISELMLKKELN